MRKIFFCQIAVIFLFVLLVGCSTVPPKPVSQPDKPIQDVPVPVVEEIKTPFKPEPDKNKEAQDWYEKGFWLEKGGNNQEALSAFDKAIELDPQMHMAYINKCLILLSAQKYDEAIEVMNKTLELTPDNINVWYLKASILRQLGKNEEALKMFDKVTNLDPKNSYMWYQKGYLLRIVGKLEESITVYDKSIEFKPQYVDAFCGKGFSLRQLGRYDEALKAYDKAIEINPEYAEPRFGNGLVLKDMGKYNEALKAFDKTLELNTKYDFVWYEKACCYALMTDKANAFVFLRKAIGLYPQCKEKAINDNAFKTLWEDDEFKKITKQ